MRFRRLLLLGLPLLVVACGEDAPDMGEAALPAETAAAADGEAALGGAVGAMASETTTTTTTTTTVPDGVGSPAIVPEGEPPPPPAEVDQAVQAVCDRVSILLITASGMGPDYDDAELAELRDGVESIGEDAARWGEQPVTDTSYEDVDRLSDCLERLDQLPV